MQEAIGNVLLHSEANELTIGCKEETQNGVQGIASYVIDNGCGFDADIDYQGKGLSNMKSRAQSLHGSLTCRSQPGGGCTITLWLPYAR